MAREHFNFFRCFVFFVLFLILTGGNDDANGSGWETASFAGKIKLASGAIMISNPHLSEKEWETRFRENRAPGNHLFRGGNNQGQLPGSAEQRMEFTFQTNEKTDISLFEGDMLRTAENGSAQIYIRGCMVKLAGSTLFVVEKTKQASTYETISIINLMEGAARFFVGKIKGLKNYFKVKTRFAEAGVEGSDFIIELSEDLMTVYTSDTTVLKLANPMGAVTLAGGTSFIESGEAPRVMETKPGEYSETVNRKKLHFACLWRDFLRVDRQEFKADYSFLAVPEENPMKSRLIDPHSLLFERDHTFPKQTLKSPSGGVGDTPLPPSPPE